MKLGFRALLTARTAVVRPPVQAEIVPSSVAQMNEATLPVRGTRNPVLVLVVGFHTMPVGAAFVGGGLGGQFDPCPTVDGGGQGITTGVVPVMLKIVPSPS